MGEGEIKKLLAGLLGLHALPWLRGQESSGEDREMAQIAPAPLHRGESADTGALCLDGSSEQKRWLLLPLHSQSPSSGCTGDLWKSCPSLFNSILNKSSSIFTFRLLVDEDSQGTQTDAMKACLISDVFRVGAVKLFC